jgi:NADH-quinone oxidoreductase subunit C
MKSGELAGRIRDHFPDAVVAREEVTLFVGRGELIDALVRLRDQPDLSFGFLSSVTATDHPGKDPRFWVVYELRSVEHAHRLRLKVGLPGDDPHVPSVTTLFPTADWHERETREMFGIHFEGHPKPVKLLLSEPFEGQPLRKDFPLMSREAKPWPGLVEGEPVEDDE